MNIAFIVIKWIFMHSITENMVYLWTILGLLFLLLEMGSPGLFFFISFSCGAITAATSTVWYDSVVTQIVLFFCGTLFSLMVLRYVVIPLLGKNSKYEQTNVYALQGKHACVIKPISVQVPGMVKIQGELWVARMFNDDSVGEGEMVEVIDVRGAHVIVKRIK